VSSDEIVLHEAARFPNGPSSAARGVKWDFAHLARSVADGIRSALARAPAVDSIGIDTWGVDYGLLNATGALLSDPTCYRDARTDGMAEQAWQSITPEALYRRTGTAPSPFQTIFQLMAERSGPDLPHATQALLFPDLLNHWLTGVATCELTNASTTGLLNPTTRAFDYGLMATLGIDPALFADLCEPGTPLGPLLPSLAAELGADASTLVTSVASHDTASAVVAVPASVDNFAFLSCGTWSILGLELMEPILTRESLEAGFSNELGVDGTVRYVRNMAGLWLLQECMRAWSADGTGIGISDLIAHAALAPRLRTVVNPYSPRFVEPGDMPSRLVAEARRVGEPVPQSPGEMARCIFDSLALAFRLQLRAAMSLTGREVDVLHIVGGGARNELLCQLTADACRRTVMAGPSEASSVGNALVQGRVLVMPGASLAELRAFLRGHVALRTYQPEGPEGPWVAAEERLER
jgi:rhamnulokinase